MAPDTEERYGLTWRVTPDLLGILSPIGRFESTNPAWLATLGYEADEIESQSFFNLIHQDDISCTEEAFERIQRGDPVLQFCNRYRHKGGGYRWLSWNCVPEGGKFYCSARDVTQKVENQQALRSKEDEARFREQFIAVLGHDLRNPLAAVSSAFYFLQRDENLGVRSWMVIDAGNRSIHRMSELIDALMDFARTRLGSGLSLNISNGAELALSLEATAEEIRAVHPQRRIQSQIDLGLAVPCDIGRVCQASSNLLANAITHGDCEGLVELIAASDDAGLRITVRNRGKAIPKDILAHLFEPFVRENARPSQEGLGLGLFICSEIAKAHGGSVAVESVGEITSFTFAIPPK